jgi:2-desacetyl-2-hydroxyethyl bacteriochlorophyllide A dehydrogenase
MKAAVITEVKQLQIKDRDKPRVEPYHALVRVGAASICGTDVHQYEGTLPTEFPRVPGHDFAGVVEEVGPDLEGYEPGDRVVVKPSFPCYRCEYCAKGAYEFCPNKRLIGLWSDGCMADYMLVPYSNLVPLPGDVSFDAASNLEPFTVAMNTMKRVQPRIGEWVVVLGQGPVGLGQTKMAEVSGARVIAVDVRQEALEMARRFGAEVTLNAAETDVKEEVMELTGSGADVVIEAAGARASLESMLDLVRKEGRLANVGIQTTMGSMNPIPLMVKALTVHGIGGNGGKGQYEACLHLTELGRIHPEWLVTHRMKLSEAEDAFDLASEKRENVIKVVLEP